MKELILLFFISVISYAEEYQPTPIDTIQMECGKEVSLGVEWSYCISKTKGSNNKNILYHLHGRNGNATWWNDRDYHTGKIHKEWLNSKIEPPVVISISFGKIWILLKDENETGLFNIFIKNVIDKIDGKLDFSPNKRSLIGISMGGLNTFYLSMSNSSQFDKAAILCAHIPFITHNDGILNVLKYRYEHKISFKRSYLMYMMSQKFFYDERIRELNSSRSLINNFNPELSPEIYITCGKKDDWGCMKSSKMVADGIRKQNGKAAWAPRSGGHCDLDHKEIANFLTK